jgi:hypothetical protein
MPAHAVERRVGLGFFGSRIGLTRDILRNTPQHSTWIEEREVAHPPRSVLRLPNVNAKAILDAAGAYVSVPVVDTLHKQVHLEVARVCWFVERLQQETRFSVANGGKVLRGPSDLEAEREIELLRLLEIARRHEGFDFDDGEVHGVVSEALRINEPTVAPMLGKMKRARQVSS